jgi:hypothetical protein
MKVYYIAPYKGLLEHKENYERTIKVLLEEGVNLLNNCIKDYESYGASKRESAAYYQQAMQEIADADLVLFDVTISSMSIGHQMAYALHLQKPTLLLANNRYKEPNNLFVAGIQSPLLTLAAYDTGEDIERIVKKYLRDNKSSKKGRLNLALDKPQQEYLMWASYQYNKSKTALVKHAINKAIQEDNDYRAFRNM